MDASCLSLASKKDERQKGKKSFLQLFLGNFPRSPTQHTCLYVMDQNLVIWLYIQGMKESEKSNLTYMT